jgi:superfamily I DNA/RNA helicase
MADLGVIDCASAAINGTSYRYGHIVVDEAQDLSYMQLRAIRRRSQNGSMTVVGDIAQATSAYARKDWNQVLTTLGEEDSFTEAELTVGYRVPAPALAVAAKVLETAAPGLTAPTAFPRTVEEEPRWHLAAETELLDAVVAAVKTHSSRGLFVGVIVPPTQMSSVQGAFRAAGMKFSESADGGLSQGINLVSPEESKGLEFDAVVVVEPKAILDVAQGAKLLYIALTRTVHHLDVVLRSNRIPPMLEEFIPDGDTQDPDLGVEEANIELQVAEEDKSTNEEHEIFGESVASDDAHGAPAEGTSQVVGLEDAPRTASAGALKPMLERVAQTIATDFFEVLREMSPSVQHRVVDLLWDKMEEDGPAA